MSKKKCGYGKKEKRRCRILLKIEIGKFVPRLCRGTSRYGSSLMAACVLVVGGSGLGLCSRDGDSVTNCNKLHRRRIIYECD